LVVDGRKAHRSFDPRIVAKTYKSVTFAPFNDIIQLELKTN